MYTPNTGPWPFTTGFRDVTIFIDTLGDLFPTDEFPRNSIVVGSEVFVDVFDGWNDYITGTWEARVEWSDGVVTTHEGGTVSSGLSDNAFTYGEWLAANGYPVQYTPETNAEYLSTVRFVNHIPNGSFIITRP
jgi:hypothetical protein